jgi:hypothetical protein
MTTQEKKAVKLAMLRHAQADVRDAVDEEQRKNGGSYLSAWARTKAKQPKLFDTVDEIADGIEELNKIKSGDDYEQDYPPYEAPKIKDNVPPNQPGQPAAKPSGAYPPDPRIDKSWPQRPAPVKDPRVQGVNYGRLGQYL